MSAILYILFCLFILHVIDILSAKTPKDDGVYVPTTITKSILTDTEFTKKYLDTFSNSTFTCIYYDKVWNEMNRIGNSGYDANVIEYTIYKYEEHLKLIIEDANNSTSNTYPKFDDYRRKVISALNDKDADTKLTIKNGSNKYSNITVLLDKIKDKDTKLMSNESESLRQNAISISELYLKYNTDDDTYKERVISQLTMIDTYLDRLMNESLLPGTKKYLENELNINQRYLDSIIDQDIIKDMEKQHANNKV